MQPPSSEQPLPEPTPDGEGDIPLAPELEAISAAGGAPPVSPAPFQLPPWREVSPEREPPLLWVVAIGALGVDLLFYLIWLTFHSFGGLLIPVFGVALLAFLATGIAMVVWGVMGTGPWYRRWPASTAIVLLVNVPMAAMAGQPELLLLCPLAVLAAQAPFWLLRLWPGYRFVFERNQLPRVPPYQYHIQHLLGATLIVAICLSLAQAGLSPQRLAPPRHLVANDGLSAQWEVTPVQSLEEWRRAGHLGEMVGSAALVGLLSILPFFLVFWLPAEREAGCLLGGLVWVALPTIGCIYLNQRGDFSMPALCATFGLISGPLTFLGQFWLYHVGYQLARPGRIAGETAEKAKGPPLDAPISPFEPEGR